MKKYDILLGYLDKQCLYVAKLYNEIIGIDISVYEKQFVFALRVQQLYTALEDLFKQIAKSFENHIENMSHFHKEILQRMNMDIPKTRPAVISTPCLLFLDKIRAFRHFVRHAYDCEWDEKELTTLQDKLRRDFSLLEQDLQKFRSFLQTLT